jgi:hypothetical protein
MFMAVLSNFRIKVTFELARTFWRDRPYGIEISIWKGIMGTGWIIPFWPKSWLNDKKVVDKI